MKPTSVAVLDAAREFLVHEMFFSTTDRRGVIRSGNEVFRRVSGYRLDALIGRPHNVIRHPDMPRAVFRLIWDYLQRSRPVAGYVKNLAADGRHYWVVAMIAPLQDGFISVRFKPTGEMQGKVEALYRAMRQDEAAAVERGDDPAGGMDRAAGRLIEALRGLGFADYDAFMTEMLHAELKSRDAAIARARGQLLPAQIGAAAAPGAARLQSIYRHCRQTYDRINRLYAELDGYAGLQRELLRRFADVVDLAHEFRLVALNATVKSAQLGDAGRCIGVIADQLGVISRQISDRSTDLAARVGPVAAGLQAVILNLAAARLQLEMIMVFCHELATGRDGAAGNARDVVDLQAAFDGTLRLAVAGLQAAGSGLKGFGKHAEELHRLTLTMQVAQVGGAVEASRVSDDGLLAQTFAELRKKTGISKTKLDELTALIVRFDRLAATAPEIVGQVTAASDVTRRDVQEFLQLIATPGVRTDAVGNSGGASEADAPPAAPDANPAVSDRDGARPAMACTEELAISG